jgi:hypothetical protein
MTLRYGDTVLDLKGVVIEADGRVYAASSAVYATSNAAAHGDSTEEPKPFIVDEAKPCH